MALVRVIGCGSEDGGDDAIGLLAVRRAARSLGRVEGVEVAEAGPGIRVLDLLEGADAAVVVDAVRPVRGPARVGRLLRVHEAAGELPSDIEPALSSHGIGVREAIELSGALGGTRRIAFVGVEVDEPRIGTPLSPPVARTLPALTSVILVEVAMLLEEVRM